MYKKKKPQLPPPGTFEGMLARWKKAAEENLLALSKRKNRLRPSRSFTLSPHRFETEVAGQDEQ